MKRILLVEDEEDNMQILRDLLAAGLRVWSRPITARRRWQRRRSNCRISS